MATEHNIASLPQEVLVKILIEYFADGNVTIKAQTERPSRDKQSTDTKTLPTSMSILLTCKLIHSVGLPLFYGSTTFHHNGIQGLEIIPPTASDYPKHGLTAIICSNGLRQRESIPTVLPSQGYKLVPWVELRKLSVSFASLPQFVKVWKKQDVPFPNLEHILVNHLGIWNHESMIIRCVPWFFTSYEQMCSSCQKYNVAYLQRACTSLDIHLEFQLTFKDNRADRNVYWVDIPARRYVTVQINNDREIKFRKSSFGSGFFFGSVKKFVLNIFVGRHSVETESRKWTFQDTPATLQSTTEEFLFHGRLASR